MSVGRFYVEQNSPKSRHVFAVIKRVDFVLKSY